MTHPAAQSALRSDGAGHDAAIRRAAPAPSPAAEVADHRPAVTWTRLAAVAVAIPAVMLQSWAERFAMNPDGVSYLDMSDAVARCGLCVPVNSWWSPLFPMFLGWTRAAVGTTPDREVQLAHGVNVVVAVLSLLAFELLLTTLIARVRDRATAEGAPLRTREVVAWRALGYSLWLWATLHLISMRLVSPDLLVSAFVYLALWLQLRLAQTAPRRALALGAALGVAVGLGYWAKTIVLPVGLVLLGTSAVWLRRLRRPLLPVALAALTCAALAVPIAARVSARVGHATIGEVGRLNMAWLVGGVPAPLWIDARSGHDTAWVAPDAGGTPLHPIRRLGDLPPVYGWDRGPGTMPMWYEITSWYDGVHGRWTPVRQARVLAGSIVEELSLVSRLILVCGVLFLVSQGAPVRRLIGEIEWPVAIVATAGLGAFGMLIVESRYLAPFLVALTLAIVPVLRTRTAGPRFLAGALWALALCLAQVWGRDLRTALQAGPRARHTDLAVARALAAAAVTPGTKVAVIGNPYIESNWARLARVRLVAAVHEVRRPTLADGGAAAEARTLDAMRRLGGRVVVDRAAARCDASRGWRPLGADLGCFLRLDSPSVDSTASAPPAR